MRLRIIILSFLLVFTTSADVPFGFFGGGDSYGGCSWEFDGSADYIAVPDDASLSFGDGVTTDVAFSISIWAYLDATVQQQFINKADVSGTDFEWILQTSGISEIQLVLYDLVTTKYILQKFDISAYSSQWVNLIATYSGSSLATGIEIYVNGAIVASTAVGVGGYAAMHDTASPVSIGHVLGTSLFLDGKIADPLIFDIELSAANATSIYNLGEPRDERDYFGANIVSMWTGTDTADGAGGVEDVGGNNTNDGTLTNMTVATNVLCGVGDYPN